MQRSPRDLRSSGLTLPQSQQNNLSFDYIKIRQCFRDVARLFHGVSRSFQTVHHLNIHRLLIKDWNIRSIPINV